MKAELAWLNYQRLDDQSGKDFFNVIHLSDQTPILCQAREELEVAAKGFYPEEKSTKVGRGIYLCIEKGSGIHPEGYCIEEKKGVVTIKSASDKGVLYGSFALISHLQLGGQLEGYAYANSPDCPMRMANHWDNMDGSIERGYSGQSFFFKENNLLVNERTKLYARLLASVGINATVINNVNVKDKETHLIEPVYLKKVRELSELLGQFGIKLYLSLNYASPMELGGLDTADPLDTTVIAWWQERMQIIYKEVPNLGGFLVKADSEGRPGPFTYGRNQAEGANMLAKAIRPYNGQIIWRCFVYNCQQDWRDKKTDRAKAGYDYFQPLDGTFDDNVILQIKNGPMDFQVREPVSPLLGGLRKTNQLLEVQIAGEYTGQQRHVCYLIPMFKEVLEFDTYCNEGSGTVADIVSGKTFNQSRTGMATVMNTGDDSNWTGHDLAAANFYGFGRLSYNLNLSSEAIAEEWTKKTFGLVPKVVETIVHILMRSWPVYENYTSPLGIGWMVEPNHHYGPNVDGYEYSRWGTYHRADHQGLGVDRSAQGTGYVLQYNEPLATRFNEPETCPDELLLFFHHLPYTYQLRSGKTVIQHIYDTHFEGADEVEIMRKAWLTLAEDIDAKRYQRTLERLEHQVQHAKEWRDQINTYFYRKSGIADEKKRIIY